MKYRPIFLVLIFFLPFAACESVNDIVIETPAEGAFLAGDTPVEARVHAKEGPLIVNGVRYKGKNVTVQLPPVDGLGFIKAEKPGQKLFSVRSYLQGRFRNPRDFQPDTVQTRLGMEILEQRPVSFSSLCEEMMLEEELVDYMPNPIVVETEIAFVPVTIEVTATSVVAHGIDVQLRFENGQLFFHSRLSNVQIYYQSRAAGISGSGQALYEWIEIDGELQLSVNDSDLVNMSAQASEPRIQDDGGIPQAAITPIVARLDEAVREAIITTTRNSSRVVFNDMMSTLVPQVALEFEHPITQSTQARDIRIADGGIFVSYETRIQAGIPLLAGPDAGVLERSHTDVRPESGMSITFGSALVNQIAFAMWDAGNASEKTYTREQLYELGMERLGGYYDRLKRSTIDLLLPPVLEWDADGPWLVIGGIEITMEIDGDENTKAHTASRVPVAFRQEGDAIVLIRDPGRDVIFQDVGFNRMSDMVDPDKVVRLLRTAVPGVVSDLFSTFPVVRMTATQLPRLNGGPGPIVQTKLLSLDTCGGFWRLNLDFERVSPADFRLNH